MGILRDCELCPLTRCLEACGVFVKRPGHVICILVLSLGGCVVLFLLTPFLNRILLSDGTDSDSFPSVLCEDKILKD